MKLTITLYIPGMPFNGATIKNGQSLGGSETAGYYVARELAKRGHQVTVFSNIPADQVGIFEGVIYQPLSAFLQYAKTTPHDVLIAQRDPAVLNQTFAAKLVMWWTHDLALRRYGKQVNEMSWNLDKVLSVSNWHKEQIKEVYGLPQGAIDVLPNGVDSELYSAQADPALKQQGKIMVYSSRPERGLANLVGPGGVMEQLHKVDPEITLTVAGYEYTTDEMRPMYEQLWGMCQQAPNVNLVGALSKQKLADLMRFAWLHVYPSQFEETSCITAMEESHAGTPFVACKVGALEETMKDSGAAWVDLKNGQIDHEGFTKVILSLRDNPEKWQRLHERCLAAANDFTWQRSVDNLETTISNVFETTSGDKNRLLKHYEHVSDVVAGEHLTKTSDVEGGDFLVQYNWANPDNMAQHYEEAIKWEKDHGIEYPFPTHEQSLGQSRYTEALGLLAGLPDGSKILDYGCNAGQLTYLMAQQFPELNFMGVDLSFTNIEQGKKYLGENPLPNLTLDATVLNDLTPFDAMFMMEVLEHFVDPVYSLGSILRFIKPNGLVYITVPFGPHESESYYTHPAMRNKDDVPVRQHLHHFEREDLMEMFGHKSEYSAKSMPMKFTANGEPLGSYGIVFRNDDKPIGKIDYDRKHTTQAPRQTISACMIVGNDGDTLAKTLKSIPFADEIIIGIDTGNADHGLKEGRAWSIAEEFEATAFAIESPLSQGFSSARNETIERATSDWIIWIDDDEVFEWPERMYKYLKHNHVSAYAVQQHHFSAEPPGLLKTDLPCRIFRNHEGIKFHGLVHEHPETEINEGVPGIVMPIPDVAICHNGYDTEDRRRARFERNWPLMQRDREANPQRTLGRFLWLRDLAHVCRYEYERHGTATPFLMQTANQAVEMWRDLAKGTEPRLLFDSLPYYSECVNWLTQGQGIEYAVTMGAKFGPLQTMNGKLPDPTVGKFMNEDDIRLLNNAMLERDLNITKGKYL